LSFAISPIQALNRVRSAVELDSFTSVEPYLKHSTSAIDTTSCFYQVCNINKGERMGERRRRSWRPSVITVILVTEAVKLIGWQKGTKSWA
jgi:hypothetical protein